MGNYEAGFGSIRETPVVVSRQLAMLVAYLVVIGSQMLRVAWAVHDGGDVISASFSLAFSLFMASCIVAVLFRDYVSFHCIELMNLSLLSWAGILGVFYFGMWGFVCAELIARAALVVSEWVTFELCRLAGGVRG